LIGGAAIWPLAARAQQPAIPLIGVLMNRAENDPDGQARLAAFLQALEGSGWDVSRNVRMETRWGAEDVELERKYAAELVALSPDILLAAGTLGVSAALGVSRTVPIVFAGVPDPVGAGFVNSLIPARRKRDRLHDL
jgi:putative ABC transport system substrate-binding protein